MKNARVYASLQIAGTQHHPEGHAWLTKKFARQEKDRGKKLPALVLKREPENKFDKSAIKVLTPYGIFLGYVPRYLAAQLAGKMDSGEWTLTAEKTRDTWAGFRITEARTLETELAIL